MRELFIRRQDRPDLRVPMIAGEGPFDWRIISSPARYLPAMKDCGGDKSGDKGIDKKDVGSDKGGRGRAQGSPTGPVTDNSVRLSPEATESEVRNAIDQTMFS